MQEIDILKFKSKKTIWIENIIIFLVLIYSFCCEKISLNPSYDLKYWLIKLSFIVCIAILLKYILTYIYIYIYRLNVLAVNKFYHVIVFFSVIMLVNIFVLILIWPGMWGGDELWLLPQVREFDIATTQHWLVAVFYIWSFMLIPSPVGIVFFIILLNVTIQTILYSEIYDRILNVKWAFLLIIPCCLPEILLFNEYPLRCSVYGSVEILFILVAKRMFVNVKKYDLIKISAIIIILATLRTETIYYLLIGIAMMLYLYKKSYIQLKKVCIGIFLITFGVWGVNRIQTALTYPSVFDRNTLQCVADPLVEMARNEAEKHTDWVECPILNEIDRTFSVELILENEGTGMGLMWSRYGGFFQEGRPEIRKGFWKAYTQLLISNLDIFLSNRWEVFCSTQKNNVKEKAQISIDLWSEEACEKEPTVLNKNMLAFSVPDYRRYETVLHTLTLATEGQTAIEVVRLLCNSIIIPGAFLILFLGWSIKNRKWIVVAVLIGVLAKIPLVYVTMPGTEYMYYYPVYYVGVIAIFVCFIEKIGKLKTAQD